MTPRDAFYNRLKEIEAPAKADRDKLVKTLGLDSLDFVELFMWAEEEFNISITDEEADKIKTVGQFIKVIEKKVKTKKRNYDLY